MFHTPNNERVRSGQLASSDSFGNNGAFQMECLGEKTIFCIASDGLGFEHVSVSTGKHECPSWEIMCYVKDVFWDADDTVIQYHPAKSEYINAHKFCLHLWRPIDVALPLPITFQI